jgi:hypothetical protein
MKADQITDALPGRAVFVAGGNQIACADFVRPIIWYVGE